MVGEGDDARRLLILDHEGEVEHVGHREISGVWIHHLGRDHRLHEVVIMFAIPLISRLVRPAGLRVADLRVEIKQRPDCHRSSEQNFPHVCTNWPRFAESEGVGPSKFISLPHDEASEDIAENISMLRVTHDKILELGILHPDCILFPHGSH